MEKTYNRGHNTFNQNETISDSNSIYDVPNESPNELTAKILGH